LPASSTGRCNTIQRTDSTVLPWANRSAWLNPVKTLPGVVFLLV
jgi:hypothetical protein